jgi:hypothetical protein
MLELLCKSSLRGEMDITAVFGTVILGSNPGGGTKIEDFCASAASHLRVMRQDSKRTALFG